MRKLFSILVVALLALSAHATVVTKDITWTLTDDGNSFDLTAWGNMSTKWGWTEGCAEYDQLVFEFDAPTGDIAVKAQFHDGTNDIASSAVLHVGDNSLAVNVTADVLHSVDVKNYSDTEQNIKLTRMYLRKAVGPKKPETLWSGSMEFSDWKGWNDRLVITPEKFADIHIGDIIEFEYTVSGSNPQLNLISPYNSYKMAFVGVLDGENYNINWEVNPTKLACAIMSADDITNLQEKGGLSINAVNITLTAVKLIKHDVLWTGTASVDDNWSGGQSIEWSKLTDLEAGNILCVRVTSGEYVEGKYNQVLCKYKNDWSGAFSPAVNYLFQEGDVMPMIVEIPITHKMLHQLNGEQLNIGGRNYTMTDIYVLEGTPTNTVAAYLNVSSAGMATYVLPFNVPSPLPDGVHAYNLTNNGDATIWAEEVTSLTADKPVLIIADAGEYEFVSENGASDDISSKTATYTNGALVGTYTTIGQLAQQTDEKYNYILQNGQEGVGFYQVRDNTCSVAPYRAYLSCGYNVPTSVDAPARAMRIVFRENTATGVDNIESAKMDGSAKFLRNGQLYILRNGVEYNANGALVK